MSTDYDVIGPWSEVKLEILREYASPYSRIVTSQGFHHLYIDGFAGRGSHLSRTTGEVVAGSPLNALDAKPPFEEYHFIDANPARVAELKQQTSGRSDVFVYEGDCNEILLHEVFPRATYGDYKRALCLLDPYNINLSWEVVRTAGQMRSIEIFLNFMVMDMNMNVLLHRPERALPSQVERMNRFWGDESWRDVAFVEDRQSKLFENESGKVKAEIGNNRIVAAYRQRLVDEAGFKFCPEPLPFSYKNGATIYYLFFASPNQTGNKIVGQIFDKYRRRKWS